MNCPYTAEEMAQYGITVSPGYNCLKGYIPHCTTCEDSGLLYCFQTTGIVGGHLVFCLCPAGDKEKQKHRIYYDFDGQIFPVSRENQIGKGS